MPFLVDMKITMPRFHTVFSGRYGVAGFLLSDIVPDFLRTIGLVAENITSFHIQFRKQINGCTCIVYLTSGEQKVDRITQCIHNCMNFGGLSTPDITN